MTDKDILISDLNDISEILINNGYCSWCKSIQKAIALLKEQEGLLGIQQTADGITFISTGTAQQGEERGILLGKSLMHE